MSKQIRILVSALALVAPSIASAYGVYNPARRWFPAEMPRTVHVDDRGIDSITDADNGVAAALAAVNAWNAPGLSIVSSVADTSAFGLGDGRSDVIFDDPNDICTGSCLAATYIGFYDSAEKSCCDGLTVVPYTDSDVVFNLAYSWTSVTEPDGCSGEFYIEGVMTHEIGHLIGLAHSNQSGAIMYPSVSACVNKAIAADDVAGRAALYDCSSFGECLCVGSSCSSDSQCCSQKCRGKKCR
jgi:hypothetical protein